MIKILLKLLSQIALCFCLPFPLWGQAEALNFSENLKSLIKNESEITGIEILVVQESSDQFYSSFGHVLLRFVDNDNQWANDYTVSFVANINELDKENMMKTYYKGTVGGFPIVSEIKIFYEFWNEYVVNGEREIYRYIIPASKKNIHQLIETLQLWNSYPEKMGTYTFLFNNCAFKMAQFLIEGGISYELSIPQKPMNIPDWLENSLMSPYPPQIIRTHRPVIHQLISLLQVNEEQLDNGFWPDQSYDVLINNFNEQEIKFLYEKYPNMPISLVKKIASRFHYSKTTVDFSTVMSLTNLDSRLYEYCFDDICIETQIQLSKQNWNVQVLKKKWKRCKFILNNYSIAENNKKPYWDFSEFDQNNTFMHVRQLSRDQENYFRKFTEGMAKTLGVP